jgi:hypothetical protein
LYFIVKNISLGARLKERAATNSPKKVQLVQKTGSKIKLTDDFQSALKDIFEKVLFDYCFDFYNIKIEEYIKKDMNYLFSINSCDLDIGCSAKIA